MKKAFTFLGLLFFICGAVCAQTNSVTLKDGGGSTVSQHNSIQSAYNAISSTVTQAYTIEIESIYTGANETFPITFNSRAGVSITNTITLRPAAGNTGETITGSSTNSILILEEIDFVVLDGRPGGTGSTADLKIENTASSGSDAHTIQFVDGAANNTLRYLHTLNGTANSPGPRNIEIFNSPAGPSGNSNNLIEYCLIEGGRTGVGLDGSPGFQNVGNRISNCQILNTGYAGVWVFSHSDNTVIEECTIHSTMPVSTSTILSGIAIGAATSSTDIIRNKIFNLQSASTSGGLDVRGVWFQNNADAGSILNIFNNFIALPLNNNNAAATIGIELDATNNAIFNVFYNSIRIGGTQTGGSGVLSACIYNEVTGAGARVNVTNNICVNNRSGGSGSHTGGWYEELGAILDIDYNCYFADGTGGVNSTWGATGYTNLATYKSAATPNEQNSVFHNVNFVSNTNLHLTGASVGDTNLKGTPITGVTIDIDGDTRNALAPYMGADEGGIVLGIQQNTGIAESYSLSQNYPNPFNPATTIKFSIPKNGLVTLKVYDITGREVTKLLNERLNTGAYEYNFDASGLTSGVYFYTLTSGDFRETKQMILLK